MGENSRDNDLVVNIIRPKHLTNVRASGSNENVLITPARKFTLEQAIVYIEDDELIEITPISCASARNPSRKVIENPKIDPFISII